MVEWLKERISFPKSHSYRFNTSFSAWFFHGTKRMHCGKYNALGNTKVNVFLSPLMVIAAFWNIKECTFRNINLLRTQSIE